MGLNVSFVIHRLYHHKILWLAAVVLLALLRSHSPAAFWQQTVSTGQWLQQEQQLGLKDSYRLVRHASVGHWRQNRTATESGAISGTLSPTLAFVIPTKGRPSLKKTLESLLQQTCPTWRAVVVVDGVDLMPGIAHQDKRISFMHVGKVGRDNFAAELRNAGIANCTEDWVAFVDDDDTISPLYVEQFFNHTHQHPHMECIIFRMWRQDLGVLPPPDATTIGYGAVGISFAVRRRFFASGQAQFAAGATEDFNFLEQLRSLNASLMISPYLAYFVRTPPRLDLYAKQYPIVMVPPGGPKP